MEGVTDGRQARADRMQERLEWPVMIAALSTIPVILVQDSDLGQPWDAVALVLNWAAWLMFVGEATIMLSIVPDRARWLRHHVIDIAVVILTPPFAPAAWQSGRLFRLIRLLRLVRLFALRKLLSLEGVKYAGGIALGTVLLGGAIFASIEETSAWNGIWWAISTVTTVGYGDVPVESTGGRIIGITIMLIGIGFVALLTAFVAERFIKEQVQTEEKEDLILAELQAIRSRLDALERAPAPADPDLTAD